MESMRRLTLFMMTRGSATNNFGRTSMSTSSRDSKLRTLSGSRDLDREFKNRLRENRKLTAKDKS